MKLARLLPFALTLLLAACGGDGPTPVPPTEPTPPVAPPTTPVDPPTAPTPPPVPPPTTPTPPTTPFDGQYAGDWIWVAVLPDDSTRTGYLTITEVADIIPSFTGEQGGYLECDNNDCESALANPSRQGTGGIGTSTFEGAESLTALFESDDGFLEVIAFDQDNRLGNEIDSALTTFIGPGGFYSGPDDDDGTDVVFGIGQVNEAPLLPLSFESLGLSQKEIDAVRAYQKTSEYSSARQQIRALAR